MLEAIIVLIVFLSAVALLVTIFYALVVVPFQIRDAVRQTNRLLSEQTAAIQAISAQIDWRNNNR